MVKESKEDSKCPKCSKKMRMSFSSISGNSKYVSFQCEDCGHKEMKCVGMLPEDIRY